MIFHNTSLINPGLFSDIWADAVSDVVSFENEGPGNIGDLLSFDDSSPDSRRVFADFARHAIGERVQLRGGKLRLYPASLGPVTLKGHVSWLTTVGPGVLRVTVDQKLLDANTEPLRVGYRFARIFLHEVGHLKYHYGHCFPESTIEWAKSCEPEHEAVAWLYAGIVTGLALGQYAYESKKSVGADNAWAKI